MPGSTPPLPYLPLEELGSRPHVMVDGAPRRGTVLTLSHWPGTPSPARLDRDTSTEIALASLGEPGLWTVGAKAVTVDHLDEDGLASLFVLTAPDQAVPRAARLVATARAGDFEVAGSREGARVAWALRHLFDPARSPLAADLGPARAGPGWTAAAVRGALSLLVELLDAPERFGSWWAAEEAVYLEGQRALAEGALELEERPQLDLALVTADRRLQPSSFSRIGHGGALPVHPAVIHGATSASRVLVRQGDAYCYYDRYESWVRYSSRKVPLRRDLGPLAQQLSALEPSAGAWTADPPGALVPLLRPAGGHSDLAPLEVLSLLEKHLAGAPPAWDPFAGDLGR